MEKFVRGVFYCIFGIFGLSGGWKLYESTLPWYSALPKEDLNLTAISFVGLGFLTALALSHMLSNLFISGITRTISYLQRSSLQQIISGSLGIIIGLILSYLITLPLRVIPFGSIPVMGDYVFPILSILLAIFFGYLGIFFGTRAVVLGGKSPLFEMAGKNNNVIWGKNFKILDTSVIIDGRIVDITRAGFIEGTIVIPRFVLRELQQIADSSDTLKRNRGRRGLDVLNTLRKEFGIQILEKDYNEPGVDSKLIKLADEVKATIITTDYNLNKLASLQEINILNINELANAVKPVTIPGEFMKVRILKEGKEPGQGVAYLDDGTMVVVEGARKHVGDLLSIEVTSSLQTVAGKMIFAKIRQMEPEKKPSGEESGRAAGESAG